MTEQVKTFFGRPGDPRHLDALAGYFQHARSGSHIYVSLSRGDQEVYDKMKSGCKATIHTNYFWEDYPNVTRIHNKFFAFEKLDYTQPWLQSNVIVVATSNLNERTKSKHESMVRFQSANLFTAFKRRWKEIEDHRDSKKPAAGWEAKSEGYDQQNPELKVKAYFFPDPDENSDVVVDILGNIDGTKPGVVRLLVPRFLETRIKVARKLKSLADGGKVEVQLITRPRGDDVNFNLQKELGTKVKYKVCKADGDSYFHSRYLTVDATYDGAKSTLTWMGTQNLSGEAIHKVYETLLKIWDKDNEVYKACAGNFDELWKNFAHLPDSNGN